MKRGYESDTSEDSVVFLGETQRKIVDPFRDLATGDDGDAVGNGSSMCATCAATEATFHFNALTTAQREGESPVGFLGTLNTPEQEECPCCRLYRSVSPPREDEHNTPEYIFFFYELTPSNPWGKRGSVILVTPQKSDISVEDLDDIVQKRGALASTSPAAPSQSLVARRIHPDYINFALLRNWISSCKKHHGHCNKYFTMAASPRRMKLIDCETRRVVPAQSFEFVALSYVWGLGVDSTDKPMNNTLPAVLPKTIEDAMKVTTKLGYNHIWIDRYCIDQDNDQEKQDQIWQMNIIYRKAQVTIVAAAGSDPHFGLPGVSTTPRTPQLSAYIAGHQFVSILPHPHEAIKNCVWSGRGWTYQEDYFSIRRLVFLKEQVYFSCYSGSAVETICHVMPGGVSYAARDENKGEMGAHEILGHLTHYSGRLLTHDSDAINAVAGVFNDYGYTHGATAHLFGVPIVKFSQFHLFRKDRRQPRTTTNAFLVGLSWMNRTVGTRRDLFPSWSWAGWTVQFDYGEAATSSLGVMSSGETYPDCFALGSDLAVQPRAFVETRSGKLLDFEDKETLRIIKEAPESLSKFIHIESWALALEISPLLNRPRETSRRVPQTHYACLKGINIDLKFYFQPMQQGFSNSSPGGGSHSQISLGEAVERKGVLRTKRHGEILGLVLSRITVATSRGKAYPIIMMVIADNGDYFERIGHATLKPDQLRFLAKQCGAVEDGWEFGWTRYKDTTLRLCKKFMQPRRLLRIG